MATKKQPKKPVAKKKAPAKKQRATAEAPNYNPSLWFEGKEIPKALQGAKIGQTVQITAEVQVVRKSEALKGGDSITAELKKIEQIKKK